MNTTTDDEPFEEFVAAEGCSVRLTAIQQEPRLPHGDGALLTLRMPAPDNRSVSLFLDAGDLHALRDSATRMIELLPQPERTDR